MTFLAIYVSGDGRRTLVLEHEAVDIDAAADAAVGALEHALRFGAGSSWFVAGVVQQDHLELVTAALEADA